MSNMKTTIKDLDATVDYFDFPHFICSNLSTKKRGTAGEQIYEQKDIFYMRNLLNNVFKVTYEETRRWGFDECRKQYRARLLDSNGVTHSEYRIDMEINAVSREMQGQSSETTLDWISRWDNGLAFTDYQERVDILIERYCKDKHDVGVKLLKDIKTAQGMLSTARTELAAAAGTLSSAKVASMVELLSEQLSIADVLSVNDE